MPDTDLADVIDSAIRDLDRVARRLLLAGIRGGARRAAELADILAAQRDRLIMSAERQG